MTRSQAVAGGILVAQAVFAYLLTQPDVVLPPLVKLVIGALSVASTALGIVLKVVPQPPQVRVD
jgi:hypothetical protein